MKERRVPIVSFVQDRLAQRAEHKKRIVQAHEIGARILDERWAGKVDELELFPTVYGAAKGELKGYGEHIWDGYYQRAEDRQKVIRQIGDTSDATQRSTD